MSRLDVVVVGGGIAGLTLGGLLGRAGHNARVLEARAVHAPVHKGELLQPASIPILEKVGALSRVTDRSGVWLDRLVSRSATGDLVNALDYRLLPGGGHRGLVQEHHVVLESIAAALPSSVSLEQGIRATSLIIEDGRVCGVRAGKGGDNHEVHADLVVACDGHASGLRRDAGIEVERLRYDHDLVAFDFATPDAWSGTPSGAPSEGTAFLTDTGLRLVLPMPNGMTRFYAQMPTDALRQGRRQMLTEWAVRLSGSTPALAPLIPGIEAAIPAARALPAARFLAGRWSAPGLVLAGDAARCVHPMAGQGMNAAIMDAVHLARALHGLDGTDQVEIDRAVEGYALERRTASVYTARLSHNLARLFTGQSWSDRVLARRMVSRSQDNVRLASILTYNVSGLGVHRYTRRDRLVQFGLARDPRRHAPETSLLDAGAIGIRS